MDFCSLDNYNKKKSSQCSFIFNRSFLVKKIMWSPDFPLFKVERIKLLFFNFLIRFVSLFIKEKNFLRKGRTGLGTQIS